MNELTLSSATFQKEALEAKVPVLVDFWAPWCGPCKIMSPVIAELAREYKGKVVVGKVNVDDHGDVASKYSIMSIPTLLLFKGGKVVEQWVGVMAKADLQKGINRHL